MDEQLGSLSLNSARQIHDILVAYSRKNALASHFTKEELSQLKWSLKTLSSFRDDGFYRYHENGFDYLPTPIITAGDPAHFKLFN